MHDLWPELTIPRRGLTGRPWQARLARKLASAPQHTRVRVARDELRRVRELTRAIQELVAELATLVSQAAPQLLAHTGFGPITTAALISEIAGIDRFDTDAKLARTAGCAPIPISSGQTDRHRLDRGGNRRLNHVVPMIAITRIGHDPETALYIAKQRKAGKTHREAIRSLKRHLIRRIWRLLATPNTIPTTVCLTSETDYARKWATRVEQILRDGVIAAARHSSTATGAMNKPTDAAATKQPATSIHTSAQAMYPARRPS